jgi:signal transduction histidine kinase/DNA-binding NarL/FixJ family response regulator
MTPASRPDTILMAAAGEADRQVARAVLEGRLAVELRFVADGEELVQYLRRQGPFAGAWAAPRPGLILLDLDRCGGGLRALEEIRSDADLRRIPVAVLTGSSPAAEVLRSCELGVHSFLAKPLSHEGLATTIRSLEQTAAGTGRQGAEAALSRPDAILEAVSATAARLLRSSSWEDEVEGVLARLGEATRVSRVYVFERLGGSHGHEVVSQRFEWADEGIASQIGNPVLEELVMDTPVQAEWARRLDRLEVVHAAVSRMPAGGPDRELFEAQAIRSVLLVPITVEGQWWGFLGLDECRHERSWSPSETGALRTAGDILGAAIQRARAERRLHEREEELRHAQKMEAIGRLAGGIAHDFNNLLTAISGYAELLLLRLAAGDPGRSDAEEVIRAARRAADLTRQLLTFSRRQVLQPRRLDLNQVVRETERMLQRTIGDDVTLVTELAEDAPEVRADPGQLEQILLNLAVNARDAMPRGGTLTLATSRVVVEPGGAAAGFDLAPPGLYLLLEVADNGVGMAPEVLAHIFEPFFTTKEKEKGTGLGLATVYGIVQQSSGWLRVQSAPGEGTAFEILLPAAPGTGLGEAAPARVSLPPAR